VDPRVRLDDKRKRKLVTVPELELRPLGRPVRSKLPHRLHYISVRIKNIHTNISQLITMSVSLGKQVIFLLRVLRETEV
jgi:hypothetical protein